MSIFSNKLRSFLGNNWHDVNDIAVNNDLIKQRGKMLTDEGQAQEYLTNFINANGAILGTCSGDFNEKLQELTGYMTEGRSIVDSIMEVEYHGVWNDTAMSIKDKYDRKLTPELIKKIKSVGLEYFGLRIKNDTEKPNHILIVPKISLEKMGGLENSIKKINKDLKVSITSLPGKNFNIADKVNKQNKKLEKAEEKARLANEWEHQEEELSHGYVPKETKGNVMEDKGYKLPAVTGYDDQYEGNVRVDGLFEHVAKRLTKESLAFERNGLYNFVSKHESKVARICEGGGSIDTYRLYALMEAEDLKTEELKENTTADISVPNLPVTSSLIRKRLNNFDPYGNNVANTTGKNSKSTIKFDADVLQESLKKMNIDGMTILATDVDTTNRFSRVIFEHENRKSELTIDRSSFLRFVERKADVKAHMEEGKLNFAKYAKSRTSAFIGTLIKEYFKKVIKEDQAGDGLTVDDFQLSPDTDDMTISYFYGFDDNAREVHTSRTAFEEWVDEKYSNSMESYDKNRYNTQNDDVSYENPRGSVSFDFDMMWNEVPYTEQLELVKEYLFFKGVGKMNEGKKLNEARFEDYNEWKDKVATITKNNFQIKRKGNNNLMTQAIDGAGKVIGEWDPAKTMGNLFV